MQSNSLSIRLYKKLESKTILYVYIPLVVYWIILLTVTSTPKYFVPKIFELQDKIEHFIAYTILAILLNLTLHFQKKSLQLAIKSSLITFLIITIYAGIDEIHQIFIPGRYADIFDWLADTIGGLFGVYYTQIFLKSARE